MARGLCRSHYGQARTQGILPPLQLAIPFTELHELSNVDRATAMADCSVCGPNSPIRVRNVGPSGRKRSPECLAKYRQNRRTRNRRLRYRLSREELEAMRQKQQGYCLICGEESGDLVIDHDHETEKVRGLLCRSCNLALGFLRDDPRLAISAARYLTAHGKAPSEGQARAA